MPSTWWSCRDAIDGLFKTNKVLKGLELLTADEAAKIIGVHKRTLHKWRIKNKGLDYVIIRGISGVKWYQYMKKDVIAFAKLFKAERGRNERS